MKKITIRLITLLIALSFSSVTLAHTGLETGSGLMRGVLHPLTGFDHLAFMLVVGLWAARGSSKQQWIPLTVLPLFMSVGAMCTYLGVSFAAIELSIALSVLIMGLIMLRGLNIHIGSVALIGFFALFHGQAHMQEISAMASPLLYSLGFMLTSCSLLIAGLNIGQWLNRIHSEWVLRGAGLVSGGLGAYLLLGTS